MGKNLVSGTGEIENALAEYEIVRKEIAKKLEIEYVQKKVRRRILKEESDEIELNFCKTEEGEEEEIDNMSMLLSNSMGTEDEIQKEFTEKELDGGIFVEEDSREIKYPRKHRSSSNKNKLMDLEADCSHEMEDEEIEDDECDLEDLIDSKYEDDHGNDGMSLFARRKEVEDEVELKKLKKKFTTPMRVKVMDSKPIGATHITDSDEGLPEIDEIDLDRIEFTDLNEFEIKNDQKERITDLKSKAIENFVGDEEEELFNDKKAALERLLKREDKYGSGFFQN